MARAYRFSYMALIACLALLLSGCGGGSAPAPAGRSPGGTQLVDRTLERQTYTLGGGDELRIIVFGEASMFSAQIGEPGNRKMGMNKNDAKDNYKLLLNSIHWLDGILD